MLKLAKDADLDLEDDLRDDIENKLGGNKRAKYAESEQEKKQIERKDARAKAKKGDNDDDELETNDKEETVFSRFKTYDDDGSGLKRRNKEDQKKESLK